MARQRGQRQNFTFNKGWNTEASPLTFPENTASDLDNVILDVDGSVRRRLGVVCESATSTRYLPTIASTWAYTAIGFFKWTNVAGSGNFNLLVSQKGTTLLFTSEDGTSYGTVDFSSRAIAARASEAPKEVIETASGLGYFFCCGQSIDPFYLEYDVNTDTISLTGFEIQIRDFDGIDEGVDVDNRPSSLTTAHKYNLRNQGWPTSFQCIDDSSNKATDDPIEFTKDEIGVYPSNADIIYFGKTATGADESEIDRYSPYTMQKNVFGTTPAPRGKYIFNAFDLNRDSIVAGALSETVNNRPQAVGFHNGRVFFAGVNAVGYTGKVYYSQQLTNINKIGKCYQQNDPTAEDFNSLLATDGGEIDIPNCGNILRVEEGPAGIVVFASNGMWEITGTEGKFSATEFYVRKVTDIGCIGAETVINADGTLYYWSDAGIVATTRDQVNGNLSADVITQKSIQLGYMLFGGPQRRGARGQWMRAEKKAVWLYSTDTEYDNTVDRFKYNGVLVLDTILGAFYKYSISDFNAGLAPYVSGLQESGSIVSISQQEPVTAGGVDVTAGGTTVTTPVSSADPDTITSTWKLQVVRPTAVGTTASYGIDFATLASRTFTDWYFEDNAGSNYNSYLETGFDYGGQAMFDKAPTYVYTYLSRVSKSATTGGYYNIPDPVVTVSYEVCSEEVAVQDSDTFAVSGNSIYVKPDGTQAWIDISGTITEYDLSTAYDISTASATGNSKLVDASGQSGQGKWTPDGTYYYYIVDDTSTTAVYTVYVWEAATAWDVTTLTQKYSVATNDSSYIDVWFDANGSNMYLLYDNLTTIIRRYAITAFDISAIVASSPTATSGSIGTFPSGNGSSFQVFSDTEDTYVDILDSVGQDIYRYTFDTSTCAAVFQSNLEDLTATSSFHTLVTSNGETHLYTKNASTVTWRQLDCELCGTLAVGYLRDTQASLSESVSTTSGLFSPDGTTYWVGRDASTSMYRYELSTGFDVSTLSYSGSVTLPSSDGRGTAFTNSGTRFYGYNAGSSTKYQYSVSGYGFTSASTIGSASITGFLINCDYSSRIAAISGNNTISVYTVGGDWDSASPTLESTFDFSVDAGFTVGQREDGGFNSDGTKFWIVTNPTSGGGYTGYYEVAEFEMSTAWNVGTATHVRTGRLNYNVSAGEPAGQIIYDDSRGLFVMGDSAEQLSEFDPLC